MSTVLLAFAAYWLFWALYAAMSLYRDRQADQARCRAAHPCNGPERVTW